MIGALSPHNIFFASWNYIAIFQRMLTITLVQFLHSWTFSKKCHVFTWFTTENHTNSSRNITWKSAHSNIMHTFSFKRKSLFFSTSRSVFFHEFAIIHNNCLLVLSALPLSVIVIRIPSMYSQPKEVDVCLQYHKVSDDLTLNICSQGMLTGEINTQTNKNQTQRFYKAYWCGVAC